MKKAHYAKGLCSACYHYFASKKWQDTHREQVRATLRRSQDKYRKAHPEKIREMERNWRRGNREHIYERGDELVGKMRSFVGSKELKRLGGTCIWSFRYDRWTRAVVYRMKDDSYIVQFMSLETGKETFLPVSDMELNELLQDVPVKFRSRPTYS
jgi:hypothetical protein